MDKQQITFRMEKALHADLKLVSQLSGKSMNRLAEEGIRIEVELLRVELERDLTRTLERLRAYSKRDPDSSEAIRAFARAEVENEDPLEGRAFRSDSHSEAQRALRRLLDGS